MCRHKRLAQPWKPKCCRCREKADGVKAFLAAAAKGYQYAAHHPEEAAKLFMQQVDADHAGEKLPSLSEQVVKESLQMLSSHLLTASGAWGRQDSER